MSKKDDFIGISNREIYNLILDNHAKHQESLDKVVSRLDVANGKIKLTRWIASTCIGLFVILLGFVVELLSRGGN